MKEGSIEIHNQLTCKHPDIEAVLYWLSDDYKKDTRLDNIEKTLFVVVEVDETIESVEHMVDNIWFGGYRYKDYYEIYDKDCISIELAQNVDDILQRGSKMVYGD